MANFLLNLGILCVKAREHTVASTGRKAHKSEAFEALASSLAEENDLPAVQILEGCKHAGSDRGHQKSFIFVCNTYSGT